VSPRIHLVVNADDLGYSGGVTRGIFEAHDNGIVTSASLMVRRAAAEAAAAGAGQRPRLGVGLHVDLGDWRHEAGGWRRYGATVDEADEAAVAAEVQDQIERFRELMGGGPTHLDSHHHVHLREPLRTILAGLAWELGLPLRHTSEASYCGEFYGQTEEGRPLPGALRPEGLAALLRRLPDGPHELCVHPGYGYGLTTSSYADERELELRALSDPRLWAVLAEERIELVTFSELRERLAA
jgi:chitin disaccharide deacetylase